jgi:Tfp pilus assembly protein PilW
VSRVRALRSERGTSVVELLTAMTILGTVLGALTGLFVSGVKSQVDLTDRVQAQNNAVLALSRLRRDVNCAKAFSGTPTSTAVTLSTSCVGSGLVSWCVTSVSANRYALRRSLAATCTATDTRMADYLRTNAVFDYQDAPTASGLLHSKLKATLEMRAPKMTTSYTLCDLLVLRNSSAPTGAHTVTPC